MRKNKKKVCFLMATILIAMNLLATVAYANENEETTETFVHFNSATNSYETFEVPTILAPGDSGIIPGSVGDAPIPNSSRSIVDGTDNRYTVKNLDQIPYRYIGIIGTSFSNGTSRTGTAFLVGDDVILTSAELVYNPDAGVASTILFEPAFDIDLVGADTVHAYGQTTASKDNVYLSENYKMAADANLTPNLEHRYAVVKLDMPVGRRTGYFGIKAYSSTENAHKGTNVTIAGYDRNYKFKKQPGDITYSKGGEIRYRIDTGYYQLGAPVYETEPYYSGYYYVMGINVKEASEGNTTYNSGRVITQALYNLIQSKL